MEIFNKKSLQNFTLGGLIVNYFLAIKPYRTETDRFRDRLLHDY